MTNKGIFDTPDMFGLFKARPTGVFIDTDIIEVIIGAMTLPAMPCYAFGVQHAPSKKWLEKYSNQITVWVTFEEGRMNKPVWLGWSWIGEQKDQYTFPEARITRSEHFHEVYDDKNESWLLLQVSGKKQFIKVLKQSIEISAEAFNIDVASTLAVRANKAVVKSNDIRLVADDADKSAVLGETLNDNLTTVINDLKGALTDIAKFGATQAAAAATPYTSTLIAGFVTLAGDMAAPIASLTALLSTLAGQLSTKVKLK